MGLFSKKPKLKECYFCHDAVPAEQLHDHWREHMRTVQADVGGRAFTFECPRCGLMPSCWGAGEDDKQAYMRTAMAIETHLMERHGGLNSQYTTL